MHNFYKKIINYWCVVRCLIIVAYGCMKILCLRKSNHEQRLIINRVAKLGAIKVLKVTKTNYQVEYRYPFSFEEGFSYVFMSNHQSTLDLPLICATMLGTIRFVAKKELFNVPLFGRVIKKAECIPIDRENPENMTTFFNITKEKLAGGVCLWVFPEGKRSIDGELLPFKAGCFRLARESAAKIIPVGIVNTKSALPSHRLILNFNQSVRIRVGKPIDTRHYQTPEKHRVLSDQVRLAIEELIG
jgi:1-acyl-sn-glycerol-3-phosphate acyltransferase